MWSPSSRGRGLKCHNRHEQRNHQWSPSSRGRGLKYHLLQRLLIQSRVALFTRAWIEMSAVIFNLFLTCVALITRAWIEMVIILCQLMYIIKSPSSRGRGLKCKFGLHIWVAKFVALFTRAWIEMVMLSFTASAETGRPLHEGVD